MVVSKASQSEPLPEWISDSAEGAIVCVHAQPGAKRNAVVGPHGASLKIALTAPPVDGKANTALLKFISGLMDIPKSAVRLVSGDTSREKRIRIQGKTAAQAAAIFSSKF